MKKLSKSKFRTGLDCPNKLYFLSKDKTYYNKKLDDPFLEALAQGGFQVEELARLHYPEGQFIESLPGDYEASITETNSWIEGTKSGAIYEAAFEYNGNYVRSDIVVKVGEEMKLIEVKAKSFDSQNEHEFLGKRGGLLSAWKPYLFDLAFQFYVASNAYPNLRVTSYLMLADKGKVAEVDGLNQLFRIPAKGEGNQRFDIDRKVHNLNQIGNSVLTEINVQDIIDDIILGKYKYHENLSFLEALKLLKEVYFDEQYPHWPTHFGTCKKCEFRASPEELPAGKQSGFFECFKIQHNWTKSSQSKPNAFEIWNFQGRNLIEENRLFMEDLVAEDFKLDVKPGEISASERRWIQVEKQKSRDSSVYCLDDEMRAEISKWNYPLHFIDFETSAVALPFLKEEDLMNKWRFNFRTIR